MAINRPSLYVQIHDTSTEENEGYPVGLYRIVILTIRPNNEYLPLLFGRIRIEYE